MPGIKESRNITAEKTIDIYLHNTQLFFCSPITPSWSALVYLSTWFLGHGPWITQPPSRVHLTVWHHLSTFRYSFSAVENNSQTESASSVIPKLFQLLCDSALLEGRAGEHVDSLETGSLSFSHYHLLVKKLCLNRNKDNVFALIV